LRSFCDSAAVGGASGTAGITGIAGIAGIASDVDNGSSIVSDDPRGDPESSDGTGSNNDSRDDFIFSTAQKRVPKPKSLGE
jgi:hypothetical protein